MIGVGDFGDFGELLLGELPNFLFRQARALFGRQNLLKEFIGIGV